MKIRSLRPVRLLALATLLALTLGTATAARAQTVINSLPYTINTPGDYVLGGNLTYNVATSEPAAITFNVGNVTLDFNGHYLSGLGAGKGTQATGLFASNRANITVQNGTVVGFFVGIFFTGDIGSNGGNNTGNVVTNMRLPSNTDVGIYLNNPVTCRVENCQVNKTGGSTVLSSLEAYGIIASGGSVTIKNNQVSTTTATGSANSYGIYCDYSTSHFVLGNQVDTAAYGIFMSSNAGKRQNNLTANCTTAFSGGIDAGGNN